jgi:hypothetical protein
MTGMCVIGSGINRLLRCQGAFARDLECDCQAQAGCLTTTASEAPRRIAWQREWLIEKDDDLRGDPQYDGLSTIRTAQDSALLLNLQSKHFLACDPP